MKAKSKAQNNLLRLTESAIMIAFAVILSQIQLVNMPFGGTVTAFSQLPIIIIAYRYGVKWGLFTGITDGALQLLLGLKNFNYATSAWAVIVIILFDYLIAFGVLGFGGIFKKSIKNQGMSMAAGAIVASLMRYACHFVSGVVVWSAFAPKGESAFVYSIVYNGTYMIPEAIITAVGAVLISLVLNFSSTDITRRTKNVSAYASTEKLTAATVSKFVAVMTIISALLFDLFTIINSFLSKANIPYEKILEVSAFSILAGVVIYLLAEIAQLLFDIKIKDKKEE